MNPHQQEKNKVGKWRSDIENLVKMEARRNEITPRCFFLDRDLSKGSLPVERFFSCINANVAISHALRHFKAKHVVTVFPLAAFTKEGEPIPELGQRIVIYYENGYHYSFVIYELSKYTKELEVVAEETGVQLTLRCEFTGLLNGTSIN